MVAEAHQHAALASVLDRLKNVRPQGNGYRASCPVPGHGQGRGDRNPSLSVCVNAEGTVGLKCHAGCPTEEVVGGLGLSMRDLFEPRTHNDAAKGRRRTVETYDYTDEAGNLLFQSVRYEPKRFSQRKPDDTGGWIYQGIFENSTQPVLYRLPKVLEAVHKGNPVWLVEGEKDVHRLEREGLTATTNPMGAGKWRDFFSEALTGADVRIVPDNDGPGREHARKVAWSLQGRAASVSIIVPPGLSEGQDISDWFVAGGTTKELLDLPSSSSLSLGDRDDDDGDPAPRGALRLTSFASVPRPSDERPAVIEGVIPQRFPSILYGDGGTAKSLLAASILLDVSRGADSWMGHRIRQHGPVIYLDFELDLEEQVRRIYQLAEGVGLEKPPEGFYYLSGADNSAGEVLERTLELANESGAVLVLLDSLGFALEGDAEASRDVLRFVRRNIKPFEHAGITPLIVDHQAKLTAGEGYHQKSPFGSVYKSNACRSVIQVGVADERDGELAVRFRHKKANFGAKFDPFEAQLVFYETKIEIRHRALGAEDIATEGSLNTAQKIRRLLRESEMVPEELAVKIGVSVGTVKNSLTKLRKNDEVEDTGVKSDTGARQVRLARPPSSSSQPLTENDDDDTRQDGDRPEVVTRTPTGTAPLSAGEWEEV